jgi:two-component system sensor histidine kinase/response regulator
VNEATQQNTETILIVDDQPEVAELLSITLAKRGYHVHTEHGGEAALQWLQAEVPDLILLDVGMPRIDGYDVCRSIKADRRLKDVPVIFVSAIQDVEIKTQAFKVGGVDYITKPYQREEVLVRVRTHLDVRRRQIELEQMQQAKDDMLRIVSHDLKNPLGAILNAEKLLALTLRDAIRTNPTARESIEIIERNVGKMLSLIRDLLDVARLEGVMEWRVERVQLTPYLEKHLRDFRLEARGKQIELRFSPPAQDAEVWLSPQRFSQVLQNLLSNAIKYTPEGGTVELLAAVEPERFVLSVRDTGLGIPAEAMPRLFEKFYRVSTPEHLEQTGTGLGLSIVKTIVEQHQGQIYVESEAGQGSAFTIVIPRLEPHPIAADLHAAQA